MGAFGRVWRARCAHQWPPATAAASTAPAAPCARPTRAQGAHLANPQPCRTRDGAPLRRRRPIPSTRHFPWLSLHGVEPLWGGALMGCHPLAANPLLRCSLQLGLTPLEVCTVSLRTLPCPSPIGLCSLSSPACRQPLPLVLAVIPCCMTRAQNRPRGVRRLSRRRASVRAAACFGSSLCCGSSLSGGLGGLAPADGGRRPPRCDRSPLTVRTGQPGRPSVDAG